MTEDPNAQLEAEKRRLQLEKDILALQVESLKSLVPDLAASNVSKIATSELTGIGSLAGHRAIDDVAGKIADQLSESLSGKRLLATTDPNLIKGEAVYHAVTERLRMLRDQSSALLGEIPSDEKAVVARSAAAGFSIPVVSAAVAGLEAVLKATSADRTLSSFEFTADSEMVMRALVGKLIGVAESVAVQPTTLMVEPSQLDSDVIDLLARRERLKDLTGDGIAEQARALEQAIDVFIETASAIGPDGESALSSARMQERFHGENRAYDYVLVVSGTPAGGSQLIDNRPFFLKDRFSVLTSVQASFVLIDTSSGLVQDAGIHSGSAQISGNIGDEFDIRSVGVVT